MLQCVWEENGKGYNTAQKKERDISREKAIVKRRTDIDRQSQLQKEREKEIEIAAEQKRVSQKDRRVRKRYISKKGNEIEREYFPRSPNTMLHIIQDTSSHNTQKYCQYTQNYIHPYTQRNKQFVYNDVEKV